MRQQRDHDDRPAPRGTADARFVAHLAERYAPPEPTAAERARFRAGLDEKLQRRSRRAAWPWIVPAAAALAAVLFIAPRPWPQTTTSPPATSHDDALALSEEDTLLALVTNDDAGADDALPEEYQAIASLME